MWRFDSEEWRFSDDKWHFSYNKYHFSSEFSREFEAKVKLFYR